MQYVNVNYMGKTYNLPRGYLSYSAYTMWKSSKASFRKRYYLNERPFETAETIFGKKIAQRLEDGELVDKQIFIYGNPEHRIEVEVDDGLKLLGYLDEFKEDTCSILEFKTGHLSKAGKVPWDKLKVRKHKQLPYYSLLVQEKYGKVDPKVILQWIETEFLKESREFDGHILEGGSRKLQLTGRVETFEREIAQWEIDNIKEDIILTAKEISEDYTLWKKENKKQ